MGRKRCGKSRNCSLRAISAFSTVFSKDLYCRHVKTRAYLGKGSLFTKLPNCSFVQIESICRLEFQGINMIEFALEREGNIVGKRRYHDHPHFLLYSQCLQKLFQNSLTIGTVLKSVKISSLINDFQRLATRHFS